MCEGQKSTTNFLKFKDQLIKVKVYEPISILPKLHELTLSSFGVTCLYIVEVELI